MATDYAAVLLRNQLLELQRNPVEGISVGLVDDNIYEWTVFIEGPPDTLYEGGFFNSILKFPRDYPNSPPAMTFTTPGFWHPNVYPDGRVCISILHPPGEDEFNKQESADERWRPILGVEAVLVSVLSMLSDPNDESPANVDAAVQWRNDREGYKRKVRTFVRQTQEML